MPIDVMRAFEKEGKIGELYKDFYSTVGTGTTEAEARRMAQEIVVHMKEAQVDAVLMVST
jgi:glycine reductase